MDFFFFLKSRKKEEPEQSVSGGMRNPNGWSSTTTYHIDSYFSTEFLSWEHVNSSKSMEINQLLSAPTRYEPLTLNAWNEHSKRLAFSGNGRRVNQSESLTRIESISWNVMIHDGFDHSLKIPWLMFDTMTKLDIFFMSIIFLWSFCIYYWYQTNESNTGNKTTLHQLNEWSDDDKEPKWNTTIPLNPIFQRI